MGDNKSKRGKADRDKAAGKQKHEVAYVAKKFKVPAKVVRYTILLVGNKRKTVETALRVYKRL